MQSFKDQRFWTDMFLAQYMKAGASRGTEPTIGLDYTGAVFQMFRAAPISDACAPAPDSRPQCAAKPGYRLPPVPNSVTGQRSVLVPALFGR